MKKILFTCVFVILIIYSCFFPEITVKASRNGILIWFNQILPALLPFTVLSAVLLNSKFLDSFSGNANLLAIIITMICGFVFGFPIGAKLSADFYQNKLLTEKQAMLLSIATNNFSPMYVCGFALPLLFNSATYNIITYLLIYFLPLLLVSIVLIFNNKAKTTQQNTDDHKKTTSRFHLNMQVMDAGIISGFQSLIKICGYIVLFSIIAQIASQLWNNPPFFWTWILENLEITNGIQLLSQSHANEPTTYILAIQLLSFGGLSGLAQTASIFSETGLSIYKYIIGKVLLSLLLTLLSVIYVSF